MSDNDIRDLELLADVADAPATHVIRQLVRERAAKLRAERAERAA